MLAYSSEFMLKTTHTAMNEDRPKQIPYGISNFYRIRTENYYYVDKTMFIPQLEDAGSFLYLVRPRRMGKSLS